MSNAITIAEARKKPEGEQVTVRAILESIEPVTQKQGRNGSTFNIREIKLSEQLDSEFPRTMRISLYPAYVDRINEKMIGSEIEVWGEISKYQTEDRVYTSLRKAGIGERVQQNSGGKRDYNPRPQAVNALGQMAAIIIAGLEVDVITGLDMAFNAITESHIQRLLALYKAPVSSQVKTEESAKDEPDEPKSGIRRW